MKLINKEVLDINRICIPEITGIYDPLSKRSDGIITPQAPVVISGTNLDIYKSGHIRLCLVPAVEYIRVIEVGCVYMHSATRIIVAIPRLESGEYFPALRIPDVSGEDFLYVFPVSLIVRLYPYERMN